MHTQQLKTAPSGPRESLPEHVRFDWYQATIHGAEIAEVRAEFDRAFPDIEPQQGVGRNAYTNRWTYSRDERVCDILYGGNKGIHVVSSGDASQGVAEVLRGKFPSHLPTRIDSALDMVGAGLFDVLADQMKKFAVAKNIKLSQLGDWTRNKGRTLYLGSRTSPVYLRLYEKGCKEGGDPNWIRLEVEVKARRHARSQMATKEPHELFGASQWLTQLCEVIGYGEMDRYSIGTVRRHTTFERAYIAAIRQYGPLIEKLRGMHTDDEFMALIDGSLECRSKASEAAPDLYSHRFSVEADQMNLFEKMRSAEPEKSTE